MGDNIVIQVIDIRGDKVRLGVTAPTDIAVHRREVFEAIQKERMEQAMKREDELFFEQEMLQELNEQADEEARDA